VPYQRIQELYNGVCTRLDRIALIDGSRKRAVAARFKTHGLETIQRVFEKAEKSEFLCGNNPRNWRADFDWLMNAANMAKVLEGKYDAENKLRPPLRDTPSRDRPPQTRYGQRDYSDEVYDRLVASEFGIEGGETHDETVSDTLAPPGGGEAHDDGPR
jgi:hypothetical protein